MSLKEINDFGALYSEIESPDTELAEDILSTIIVDMFREGYSAEATMSYLDEENHVDICEKYEEIYERVEDFLLEYEYAEYFGEDTTILSEQLELLDEKWKRMGINYVKEKGKKLLQSTGNVLKGLGKPNKKQLDLIKKAQKLNKGEKLSKWQQGRFNKALKKGKDADTALRFSKSTKEPSFLGKVSNVAKSFWKNKTARNTAIVGGAVVGLDAISKTDKAKEEGDKLITGDGKGKNGDTSGSGKPKPISSLGKKKEKPKLLNQPKTEKKKLSNIPPSEGNAVINGKKINPDFGKETDINKQNAAKAAKEKERTDWLAKTKNSPAAKAGLSDDLRWKARQNHQKWKKENNRGEFKVKTKEVPSKFAANKDKDTFKRRDAKLVAKGLKPPTYTKKVKVQEDLGPRLVKRALQNLPSELAPAALMSGVLGKAKGFANKNTFIKGAIDGATGTTKLLRKMVTPPKGRKLTPNVKSTERIAQGGALAVRKPSPSQKIKDTAGDVAKKVGETVKGTAEKLKKVKLKNPIPKAVGKAVGNYGVPVGVGVGIHKTLNREDYEPFDLVLDYLVETQQVDSVEEALYVMMEMDQDMIYGIVQERAIIPGVKAVQKPLKKVVKKTVETLKDKLHGGLRKPSTGKYTVKGGRKVKATQGAKQEGTFNTRQKDKLKAQQAAKPEAKAQADAAAKVNAPRSGVDVRKGKAPTKDADARNMKGPKYENYDSGLETAYQSIYEKAFIKSALKGASKAISKAKVGKKMPAHVKDSIKRQYKAGTPGAQPYTIEDKKNVINWYKDNK